MEERPYREETPVIILDDKFFPSQLIKAYETGIISDNEFYEEISRSLSLICS